jgi:hypothetical protein
MRLARLLRLPLLVAFLLAGALALATPASAAVPAHGDCDHSSWDDHGWGHGKAQSAAKKTSSSTVKVAGGSTSLTVAAGTVKVLTDNKVSVTATSGASGKAPTFTFPITGGSVVAATAAGTITHRGGLTFTAGGTSLTVENFTIDTKNKVLTAQVGDTSTRIPLLNLNTGSAKISMSGGNLVVSNVGATLTSTAADALNKTFKVSLFKGGLTIGTAKVTAKPA